MTTEHYRPLREIVADERMSNFPDQTISEPEIDPDIAKEYRGTIIDILDPKILNS